MLKSFVRRPLSVRGTQWVGTFLEGACPFLCFAVESSDIVNGHKTLKNHQPFFEKISSNF